MLLDLVKLFDLIMEDDLNGVKEIMSTNPSLINDYLYGVTPFLYSIECGKEEIAIELCNYPNLNFDLRDNLDVSCLEKCIQQKMCGLVEVMHQKNRRKFNVNEQMSNEETLLTYCLKNNDTKTAIFLIDSGADLNKPNMLKEYPIQLAIKFNNVQVIKAMTNKDEIFLGKLGSNYVALLDACEQDLTEIAFILIENGSDINAQDQAFKLWTPLMHAINNNNEKIALKLLEKKCDLSIVDTDGNSCLHLAVISENDYLVRYLLKANANKSVLNKENQSPMDLAKLNQDDEIIQLLS